MELKGKNTKKEQLPSYRVNREIYIENKDGMVRLILPEGGNEICHITEARKRAEESELDLVEIKGDAAPPVLKICDYSKLVYEYKKSQKKNKNNAKPLKEIQLSVSIASNDMQTKANNARKFLEDGSKVKVVLSMRGREKARREENKKSIFEFITMLEDVAVPESMPKDEGDNKTIVILKKKK
jgi:translation initiation factor IF-3